MFERTFNQKIMSPRTKSQFEEIRQKSKEKIENIALELFALKGYHATSISQIAEKAEISKGLLYNYFDSKEHLLDAIIMKVYDELIKIIKMNTTLAADKQIEQIIIQTTEHLKKNVTFWRLYLFLVHQSDVQKKLNELYKKMRDNYLNFVAKLFEDIGSQNPEMDAMMLGTMFDGIGLNYVTVPEDYPIDEMTDYLIEVFVKNKKVNNV